MIFLMEFQKMELIAMINSVCLGFRLDDVATELDQLRSGIDFSLKYRACKNHQKVADDFVFWRRDID